MKKQDIGDTRQPGKRRWLMPLSILFLLMFLLAACGGQAPTTSGEEGAPATNGGEERTVKHAMGETKVPAHPQRVVVLDTGELDAAILLGITPVGSVSALQDGGYLNYIDKGKLSNVTNVGTIAQPNLEKIASLAPDLILSSKMRHENIYTQLAGIAPTVFAERVGVTWKANFKLYAEALGKSKEAEQMMQDYDRRISELKQKMGSKLESTQISIVRVLPDRVRLYQQGSFIGTVLKDAGLPRPSSQQDATKTFTEVNYENIPLMDGTHIFVMQYGNSQEKQQELMNQPQWKQLNGVKSGNVHSVNDDIWSLGIGMGAAYKVIDDLNRYVAQ